MENQPDATAHVLDIYTHDAQVCDNGAPCMMCRWANEQESQPRLHPYRRPTEAEMLEEAVQLAYQWMQREFPQWSNERWDAKAEELGGLIHQTITNWLEQQGDDSG